MVFDIKQIAKSSQKNTMKSWHLLRADMLEIRMGCMSRDLHQNNSINTLLNPHALIQALTQFFLTLSLLAVTFVIRC